MRDTQHHPLIFRDSKMPHRAGEIHRPPSNSCGGRAPSTRHFQLISSSPRPFCFDIFLNFRGNSKVKVRLSRVAVAYATFFERTLIKNANIRWEKLPLSNRFLDCAISSISSCTTDIHNHPYFYHIAFILVHSFYPYSKLPYRDDERVPWSPYLSSPAIHRACRIVVKLPWSKSM